MSLLGLIYGSTIACTIAPFNIYIHFRHLQTYKANLELVLRIMRVINIYRAGTENIQKWKDKICTFLCYRGTVREFEILLYYTNKISQPQGEAAARKAARKERFRTLLPSLRPAKLRQRRNLYITYHKLTSQHLNLKT